MRASVASLSKKFISTFFAATLALGLVPAAAFAANDETSESADADLIEAIPERSDVQEPFEPTDESQDESVETGFVPSNGEEGIQDNVVNSGDSNLAIPAVTERVNEDVALTQPVAQQESTRSYFLAQTLESTKTVPIVSANLPLDKGTTEDVIEPNAEGEGSGASEDEGGEDSDESDLPASNTIAAASTVVGSFEQGGIVYAVEPGGESVAVVASDYDKLPEASIEKQTIVLPSTVTADYIDYYSVTRIADYAFASLTSEAASTLRVISTEASDSERSGEISSEEGSDETIGITVLGIPSSITAIGDNAFSGFDTLQYIVVEEGNPSYASYDGALYSADLTNLRLIPEGRVGTVRVAPSATMVEPEAFSHCPSVDTVVADPDINLSIIESGISMTLNQNPELASISVRGADDGGEGSLGSQGMFVASYESLASQIFSEMESEQSLDISQEHRTLLNGSTVYTVHANGGRIYGVQRYWNSDGTPKKIVDDLNGEYEYQSSSTWLGFTVSNGEAGRSKSLYNHNSDYSIDWVRWCEYNGIVNIGWTGSAAGGFGGEVGDVIGGTKWPNATLIYAVWPTSTVALDKQGGSNGTVGPITATVAKNMPTITKPNRDGYSFDGYYAKPNGEGTKYYRADGASETPWDSQTITTIYANWIPDLYEITLDNQSADLAGTTKTSVRYTMAFADNIDKPSRDGYDFQGYYTGKKGTGTKYFDKDGKPTANKWNTMSGGTLYAYWTNGVYAITLNSNNGSGGSGTIYQKYADGWYTTSGATTKKTSIIAPTRTGHTFRGYATSSTATEAEYWKTSATTASTLTNMPDNRTFKENTTLYAIWDARTYTISWDMKGHGENQKPGKTSYTYGDTYTLPSIGDVTGWTFEGWHTNSTCTSPASNITSTTTGDKSFYAKWTVKTYTITWNMKDHGTAPSTTGYTYGTGYALPTVSNVTGWDFIGWYTNNNCTIAASDISATDYGDKTFYAKWERATYTITWNMKDHGTAPSKTGYTYGDTYTLPTVSEDGWIFDGWYTNSACTTSASNISSTTYGHKTFYAKWTRATYTITWNMKDHGTAPSKTGYTYGDTYTLPTVSETGWEFKGWYTNDACTAAASDIASTTYGDKTFYAKWERAKYTITWEMKGHGLIQKPSTTGYTYGDTLTLPALSDDGGWEFKGWYTDTGCTTKAQDITATTTSNKTFYTKWDPKTYAISYEMKGHGSKPTSPTSWKYGTATSLPDPEKVEGWAFGGWYTDNNCSNPASITATTTGPLTVYAKWTKNEWKVSWNFDGAENKTNYTDANVAYGSTFTLVEPGSKAGYKFTGWKATGADTNTYDKGKQYTMPDGDVTFTAQWSAHPYTTVNLSDPYLSESAAQGAIYYWPEKGYVQSESSTEVKTSGIVTPPNLARLGYEFKGWYDVEAQNGGNLMIDANGDMVKSGAPSANTDDGAIVWYAHWARTACPVNLAASYEPSEGESAFTVTDAGGPTSITLAKFGAPFNESTAKLASTPKRVGYAFKGYYFEKYPEMTKQDVEDGKLKGTCWIDENGKLSSETWFDIAEKKQPVTLYAAWVLDQCEVTFDPAGGLVPNTERVTVVSAPESATWIYGQPKTKMTEPSEDTFYRNGYTFGGWYYLKDASAGHVESNRQYVSDAKGNPTPADWLVEKKDKVTLYPAWTAKTYTVKFDDAFPPIEGDIEKTGGFEPVTVSYDQTFDLSAYVPTFGLYEFAGWYTQTDQLFEGAHMTANADGTKRFTPKGSLLKQDPITLKAIWTAPGMKTYHLYVKAPGTDEVTESVHDYYYTDTVKFNGTEAPVAPAGYAFVGWVEYDDDESARDAAAAGVEADAMTTGGFGPYSNRHRYFVAKWTERELSVSFQSSKTDDETAWLTKADRLKDYAGSELKDFTGANAYAGEETPLVWTRACENKESRPDLASGLSYDVNMKPFVLPDVVRKGQVFKGWRLASDTDAHAARGIVVDPAVQKEVFENHELTYVPVFEDAKYRIVLDGNGYGQDQVFENVAYSDTFEFPYPIAKRSGAAFVCWATDTNTTSTSTYTYSPLASVSVAPVYDEAGENVVEGGFGLAQLDEDDEGEIRLYAVWHAAYNVELPLFANLAIDTERGDVIAGKNTIGFSEKEDTGAIYNIESIHYEPMATNGHVAFEGAPSNKVFLSVYAGLDPADDEHVLYADNVRENGVVRYTDSKGETQTVAPLLIELGGSDPVLYTRTAPTGQTWLDDLTDASAPNGFVPFGLSNPLTIRYGLYFADDQVRKAFASNGKYDWLLPEADAKNESTSVETDNADYGRRTTWSSDTVEIAKLRYTVSVSNTK